MKKILRSLVAICIVSILVLAGCNNAASGDSGDTPKPSPSPTPTDYKSQIIGTYYGDTHILTFNRNDTGTIENKTSSNTRAVQTGGFTWTNSGTTISITMNSSTAKLTATFSVATGHTDKKITIQGEECINGESAFSFNERTGTITFKGTSIVKTWQWAGVANEIKSIVIQNGVKTIGPESFSGFNLITNIIVPDSTTSIGNSAFAGCAKLSSVTIGKGVTNIGSSAFSGCKELNDLKYTGTAIEWEKNVKYDTSTFKDIKTDHIDCSGIPIEL